MLKTVMMLTSVVALGISSSAMAQTTVPGNTGATPPAAAGSDMPNGQETGTGANAKTYGQRANGSREQPEQKLDQGSGSGKK
ncbi:MAG: hypothetical protein ACREMY_09145 [bacterium]